MTNTNSARKFNTRSLRIETLEAREMLSVSVADFTAIKSQYADLELGNYADYNIIEITTANLTATSFDNAITQAGVSVKPDLIVARTTATQNTISSAWGPNIDIPVATKGSITIVGFGVRNLTITGGASLSISDGNGGSDVRLAGITVTGADYAVRTTGWNNVVLTNCTANANYSTWALGTVTNTGDMTISNSTISNNGSSAAASAGGIHNTGNLIVRNTTISENVATGNGGGIYSGAGSTLQVLSSTIKNNTAFDGGGLYDAGTSRIAYSTIDSNNATNGGGGVFVAGTGWVLLENTTVSGNKSGLFGGGIRIATDGVTYLQRCTISGNEAGTGSGGIDVDGVLRGANTIISGNKAAGDGGGVGNYNFVSLSNCSVVGNISTAPASSGGGIYTATTKATHLYNTVVAYNRSTNAANELVADELAGTWLTTDNSNYVGTAPGFTKFAAYSAASWTKTLWKNWDLTPAANSALINAGDQQQLLFSDFDALTDYAGTLRLTDRIDIGAIERIVATLPAVPPAAPTVTLTKPTANSVKLNWNQVAGATSYSVYRSSDGGKTYQLVVSALAARGWTDANVANGSYTYAVRGYNGTIRGDAGTANVTVGKLAKPTGLTATAAGNVAKLTWNAVPGAAAYYIYRSADGGKTFTLVSTRLAKNFNGKKPYFDDVVGKGSYIYAIRAYDSSLSSAARSDAATATVTV
jgi:predicted outer membrane repeat protein